MKILPGYPETEVCKNIPDYPKKYQRTRNG
jgi:hypothetical protein